MRTHLLLVSFVMIALLAGFLISQYPSGILIWVALSGAIFIIAFIDSDWGFYILIFSMLLSPEITIGETAGGSLGRGVTLRFEDFLLIIIGFSWFAKNAVHKELGLFLKTPLNKAILFYVLSCLISTGFGIINSRVSLATGLLYVLKYIEYFIVFFMIINNVKSTEQVRRFVFCLLLTCLIIAVIGILQIPGGERVSAPFEGERGEPNTLGGYLLFIGAIAAGLLIKVDNSKLRNSLILLILLAIPPLLFTQSRSTYLGLVPVCLILGLFTSRKIIVVGILAAGFVLSPLILPSQVKNRILYTFSQTEESGQIKVAGLHLDTSTSARLISLKQILRDWPEHPLVGYGVTGYEFIDSQLPKVLIETGILGLLSFFYLLYSIFRVTVKNLREVKTPYFKGLALGFLAGFTGLLFHSLGANTFIIVRIMEPFWFFAAIIVILPELERREKAQVQEMPHRAEKLASVN